jgi:EAL domain-containing protein (putative c-di-GMP-specific phosphodiesterase class I)
LIVPLGKRIIHLACGFLKRLESSGIHDKVITINISAIQLKRDDFLSDLLKEIAEVNVNACNITLEITESVFSDNFQIINEKLPDEVIVGDIISMAHKLGHCVVAEGVEQEEQKQYLIDHQCDYIQGYLLSRPLPEEKAFQMLE